MTILCYEDKSSRMSLPRNLPLKIFRDWPSIRIFLNYSTPLISTRFEKSDEGLTGSQTVRNPLFFP